jgi:plasmid segregation protein ParM
MFALDPGYGYHKAVSAKTDLSAGPGNPENQELFKRTAPVLFPSVIAPASKGYGKAAGHTITLRRPGEINPYAKLFFGQRAINEARAVQMNLSSHKFTEESSKVLALGAAYLAGVEGQVDMCIGIPISLYKNDTIRREVEKAFREIGCHVSVDDGRERYISFQSAYTLPQGVGVVYSMAKLPENGLVGVVCIGFHTTELVLFEVKDGHVGEIYTNYFKSVPLGVSRTIRLLADALTIRTGESLTLPAAMSIWSKQAFSFRRTEIDVLPLIGQFRKSVATAVCQAVDEAWIEVINRIDHLYFAGGGATEFTDLLKELEPGSEIVPRPQIAQAIGFYKMLEMILEEEKSRRLGLVSAGGSH